MGNGPGKRNFREKSKITKEKSHKTNGSKIMIEDPLGLISLRRPSALAGVSGSVSSCG